MLLSDIKAANDRLREENEYLRELAEENRRKSEQWKMLTELFEKEIEEAKKRYNIKSE